MYWNIFWVLLFITSKHYVAGGMLDPVVKKVQEVYTDERETVQNEYFEMRNKLKGLICDTYNPYRTMDGTCNNEKDPGLGASWTAYQRFWCNSYCDGIEELPCSKSNDCLPSARLTSAKLYDDKKKLDPAVTLLTVPYGQLLAHDLVRTQIGARVTCCENGKYTSNEKTHPKCASIDVPEDDCVYGPACIKCLNFVRTDTDGCKPVNPTSATTHWCDLSVVYGSDDTVAYSLRTGSGGKMQSAERHGKEWLPQNMDPMEACFNLTCPEDPCYRAGDERVNQNTLLTFLQTMMVRFHNDCAEKICGVKNCPWDDEKCFQETRRILIAVHQHIAYEEYLPVVLGKECMYDNKVIYKKSCRDEDGYIDDYSCDCDPSMSVECASAAFRGQHSAIPGFFKLYFENEYCKDKKRCDEDYFDVTGSLELSAWMNKPSVIEKGDNSIGLSRCFFAQRQHAVDPNFDDQITQFLFKFGGPLGTDLTALDIQRARDHGVPTYCTAALECGTLSKCDCFDDLKKVMPAKYVAILKKLYKNVCDVELMTGGMVERNCPGTLVGPTFKCILLKQFRLTRCADRFWYERGDQKYPFTPAQLENLRQMSMASIICQYGDGIDKIQKNPFKKISKTNPLMNCCDIPTLDYSLFKSCEKK